MQFSNWLRFFILICSLILIWGEMSFINSLQYLWEVYHKNREDIIPFVTLFTAMAVAIAYLWQASTASKRHEEQTEADKEQRITESFSKAVEQIAGEEIVRRLGGIYTLERIYRESPNDYWTIMEILAAFIRQRAPLRDPLEQIARPQTDIAAALTVITRRSNTYHALEKVSGWMFNLAYTDLRGSSLNKIFLEGANLKGINFGSADLKQSFLATAKIDGACFIKAQLMGADFKRASLGKTNFEKANLIRTQFSRASLREANFKQANLIGANFGRAKLRDANFEGANLKRTNFEKATLIKTCLKGVTLEGANLAESNLKGAYLEGADLRQAIGLSQEQLNKAKGDALTKLPTNLVRPAHWPSEVV